jgi:hypothetical protein
MRWLSRHGVDTPITKAELFILVGFIDDAAEAAEADIIARIPGAHPGRQWLIDNADIGRRLLERVAERRREVL